MKRRFSSLAKAACAVAALTLGAEGAFATEGAQMNGVGARNKAMAGAGVADQNDATAIAVNPAGLVHAGSEISASITYFSPQVSHTSPLGTVDSDADMFILPNFAYSVRHDANTVFGLSMYGIGGMGTNYPYAGPNLFGGAGDLGIDLMHMAMSASVAKQYGNLAVGIAPMAVIQVFDANGVQPFGSDNGYDTAIGVALRAGIEYQLSPGITFGVSGVTPTATQRFSKYTPPTGGFLLARGGGRLEQPASIQAGVSMDLMQGFTISADYKRIFYGSESMFSHSASLAPANFPPGFGWDDINIYKVGVEWDVNDALTLRAGYSYNDSPLGPEDLPLNIMAPAISQHHITAGLAYEMMPGMDIELAGMYSPEETLTNPNAFGPGLAVSTSMSQFEITAGIKMKLGGGESMK